MGGEGYHRLGSERHVHKGKGVASEERVDEEGASDEETESRVFG